MVEPVLTVRLQFSNDRRKHCCRAALQALTHGPQAGVAALCAHVND